MNTQLLKPKSIVVVGGSSDIHKPGGKVLKNLLDHKFKGNLYVSNPKEDEVQGVKSYRDLNNLPQTDLAILAIPAKFCYDTIKILCEDKATKAFIILSAGFSESGPEGAKLERAVVELIEKHNGVLIGPNGIGVLTPHYAGVFTSPIPKLDPKGVDFISGSGATAVFILDLGIPVGLKYASVWSVGNSAQIGVEEILEYMDENFDPEKDSKVKLLYLEQITKPKKLLKHASSLINGRQELITIGSIFMYPELKGKNIAIVTHAGGPAVMLTDALEKGGLNIPQLKGEKIDELKSQLFHGSSTENPIDFLATGTAEQLGLIIDYCENNLDNVDAIAVIFGTPGLVEIFDAYRVLDKKIKTCKKPILPICPSVNQASAEVSEFIEKGNTFFPEEVLLGDALAKIYYTAKPQSANLKLPEIDVKAARKVVDEASDGYLNPEKVQALLDAAGISRAKELVVGSEEDAVKAAKEIGYPLVMKVVGPVHKSDVGGVVLNVKTEEVLRKEFNRMIKIQDTTGILLQPFLSGKELFAGAKREDKFGHLILAGMGGIFIEVLKDVQAGLSPVSLGEAQTMIKRLKSYKIIEGVRGQAGIDEAKFADIITRLSALTEAVPEIAEMDLNPLLGDSKKVVAVDARIRIEK